ncbi:MAG: PEP-CTERM sorting domain-containing protein [Candidatus Acidiferrales bacterium]
MRFKTLAAILFLFLSTALTASANSVQGKSKSKSGDSPYLTDVGSSATSGGTTMQPFCPVSLGCPSSSGGEEFLEVTFPATGFTPGALFNVNGINTSDEVDLVCDYSLIGACDSGLSSAQQTCVNTIGGTIISASTYQVAIPNCSGFSGTEMTLLFGVSGDFSSIQPSMSVTPASATAPEPGSLMLLAFGVVAVLFKRRAIAGASVAS